jgi:hypothetical protein
MGEGREDIRLQDQLSKLQLPPLMLWALLHPARKCHACGSVILLLHRMSLDLALSGHARRVA